MARYKVDITGINTNDIKVLTNEEMNHLFVRLKNGDIDAKTELINGNLKLVLSILRGFNRSDINLDDLFQVGVIGLIKAIDNFDLSYGLKLSTYAVPLIVGEIKRYIRDNTQLRVSRSIKDLAYQITCALDSLKDPTSIFEPIYNDGGDTIYLFDQIADNKDKNSDKDMLISLRKSLLKLKKREKEILLERYIVGKTQMEIANNLGISQAQVSRLEKSALANLKKMIK